MNLGLSWDAMLKFTGVRLRLLTCIKMLLMIELGIREGVSQVRIAKNISYLKKKKYCKKKGS